MIGRTALVTGAARRVGRAIALELHASGANVAVHYREAAEEAADLIAQMNRLRPNSAIGVQADLLKIQALSSLVEQCVKHFGRLDVLVNNASSFFPTPFESISQADWDDLIGSNLKAPLFLVQKASPYLKEVKGCVINITDIHAERPLAGYSLYCVAKSGLLGLTRALAIELSPDVRVNAVAPGAILWPKDGFFSDGMQEEILEDTLLKRPGTAEEIAKTVKFLASDASYVTGQVINVDGGRTSHL